MPRLQAQRNKHPLDDAIQRLEYWCETYHLDRLWRKKYDVPIFSQRHLETDFVTMFYQLISENVETKISERNKEKAILLDQQKTLDIIKNLELALSRAKPPTQT